MRALTALVAALAMFARWTNAQAAEPRTTKFVFDCGTPDGAQAQAYVRQQCLDADQRKISRRNGPVAETGG